MTITTIERDTASHTASQHLNPLQRLSADVSASTDTNTVLQDAGLAGWNIHLRPLQTVPVEAGYTMSLDGGVGAVPAQPAVPAKDAFATVRTSPHTGELEVVGVVGKKYTPHQNEDMVEFLDALVGASGGNLTGAADYYGNGKQVFFTIDLPQSTLVGRRDLVDHSVTIFTSHNGSMAITPVIHSLRIICANMKTQAIQDAAAFTRIRHTGDLTTKLEKARTAMGIAVKQIDVFNEQAEALISKKLDDEVFWGIVADLYPLGDKPSERAKTFAEQREHALTRILHGRTNAEIDGTAWAGFNTITEYLQHNKDTASEARRALSPTGVNADLTNRAMSLFLSV